jgi:hypothetical protein
VRDARDDLQRLWDEHLDAPFPYGYSAVEERFGSPDDRPEVRAGDDFEMALRVWGSGDLHLYDTYVAGHIHTVLTSWKAGTEVLLDRRPDDRLRRYFVACLAEADDDEMRGTIQACVAHYERLNEMLRVARDVDRRLEPPE